jgi:hypothetical protein
MDATPDRAPATSPAGAQPYPEAAAISVACHLGLCQGSNPGWGLTECGHDDECACECHHA